MADKRSCVFLDRDGTINVEKEYLHRSEEFEFIPGAPEAVRKLKAAGFMVIVVTNQSGIGRGYYDEEDLARLHSHMDAELARFNTAVDAYYFCPHHPHHGIGTYATDCDCRKPLPGMLIRAASDYSLDLKSSYMIGDKLADVEAGLAAGCTPLHVQSGYGKDEVGRLPGGVASYPDLAAAVAAILAKS
jgi:D-glycero-D-manno-heptose 1,7-bisphosphate phosphatase